MRNLVWTILKWLGDIIEQIAGGDAYDPTEGPQPPPNDPINVVPPEDDKPTLVDLCKAIRDYEGQPPSATNPKGDLNWRNNNPLNFRCSSVGYLPKYGNVKCVNNFAVFESYAIGWEYGVNAVKHKIQVNPSQNLIDFFEVYAPESDNNNPHRYAKYVANRLGVPVTYKLGQLLT